MICRGVLVYRLALFRATAIGVMRSAGVVLLECRVRLNFQRLRRVLPNAVRVFRWMTISGARGSIVDASRVRPIPRRIRLRKLRRRRRRLQVLQALMCRQLRRRRQSGRRRHRVQLLDLSRAVMKDEDAWCGHRCLRVRNV